MAQRENHDSRDPVSTVAVVVPAYNVASFLEAAVRSALNQSFGDVTVIVVEDSSVDETPLVASRLAAENARVQVLSTPRNLGSAGARNLGLAAVQARYVAFLDGDDAWAPDKLRCQLELLKQSGAALCYTAIQKIDSRGRPFGKTQSVPETVHYDELLGNPLIGCSTVLLDYEALGRPLMPDIRKRQDFAFWLSLLRGGARAVGINAPLTYYRVRPGSLSSNKASAARYVWQVYREFERLPLRRAIPNFISYAVRGWLKRLNR